MIRGKRTVIYEEAYKKNPLILSERKVSEHISLQRAKERSSDLKHKLSKKEDIFFTLETTREFSIPCNSSPNDYLRIFDIVRRKITCFPVDVYHVGIYLGDKKVCNIYSEKKESIDSVINERRVSFNLKSSCSFEKKIEFELEVDATDDNLFVRIDDWNNFVENTKDDLTCSHQIIHKRSKKR